MTTKRILKLGVFGLSLLIAKTASAHEAYVLDKIYFWKEINSPYNLHALDALRDPHNLHITLAIVGGVLLLLVLNFIFRSSSWGYKFNRNLEKLSSLGPVFVRLTIAASFFFSAQSWSFLGPELALQSMPYAGILRVLLFAASFMIAAGFLTEVAAVATFFIFCLGFHVFGMYVATYLNYLGEIIVLILFGMRQWSVDRLLFGKLRRWVKWEKYGTSIVRVFYGLALAYAGLTVKFLHPDLTVKVVTEWHLTQFHWLFPSDPLLVTLGAGLAEMAIGIFIVLGFEMRLTVFISLIYITLSLIYFRELVWPHLMLYGISLNLLVQPEIFTLDHLMYEENRRAFWKLPFRAHGHSPLDGKSADKAVK